MYIKQFDETLRKVHETERISPMTTRSQKKFGLSTQPTDRATFFDRLLNIEALWRQRRSLAELDDHLLRDIGLTRDEARRESERPAWDAPAHWRR